MGFLYAAPQHQENEPLEYGWMTRTNSRYFSDIANYVNQYNIGSERYDMGQRAQLQLLPIALPALRQIVNEWTPKKIYDTLSYYNNNLAKKMIDIGLNVIDSSERGGHMLGIHFDSTKISGQEILDNMKKENVYVSIRAGSVRISPHLYCKQHEFDKLVNVIQNVVVHKMK